MARKRLIVHTVFVLLLPIVVAAFGVTVTGSVLLVLLMLLWRWIIVLSGLINPETVPEVQLDSISASHFVEKVRWCLDRLHIDYTERQSGGTLGAWFMGRTVPRLQFRSGAVRSSIGNSAEILRYLWGAYADDSDRADFLMPTPARLELEQKLDQYGRNEQVWVYYHLRGQRQLTLHLWGANDPAVPTAERWLLRILYPLLSFLVRQSFRVSTHNYEKAVQRIEELLSELEMRLSDGRKSILGDEAINFTDIAFAALSGLWLQPPQYGGGRADQVRPDPANLPAAMRIDVTRWREDYPKVCAFVENLYANERYNE